MSLIDRDFTYKLPNNKISCIQLEGNAHSLILEIKGLGGLVKGTFPIGTKLVIASDAGHLVCVNETYLRIIETTDILMVLDK